MRTRLLDFLRCPDCGGTLELVRLVTDPAASGEVSEGLLHCARQHWFPVVRGIPRMLPDALEEHWDQIARHVTDSSPEPVRSLMATRGRQAGSALYDRRTRENFSHEWDNHELGGRTWGMGLEDRIEWFFLTPIRLPLEELDGKVLLDAGCGNGSQSVAYTRLGLEVIAVDLSSGLEHGHAFRKLYPHARPERVHFVQADLQHPPLAHASVDLIHSAGVLHHTPDTRKTFETLCPLLRPAGTFYVWLYKHERFVTPLVNTIRALTTRLPAALFARMAQLMAVPFRGFCMAVNALGIRAYGRLSRREAALALMDIFGAPYAHYFSYEEVADWFRAKGFEQMWLCNESRRGFGVCGRLAAMKSQPAQTPEPFGQPALASVHGGEA